MPRSECLVGTRILVVEDEPETREVVALVLRQHGAMVREAKDGHEALAAFDVAAFDVVVSDLSLPGIDGWELLKLLRERGVAAPALALSANTSSEDTTRALHAGFDAHLAKPIGSEDLLDAVLCVVDLRSDAALAVG